MKEALLRTAGPSQLLTHSTDFQVPNGKYVGALVVQLDANTFKVYNHRRNSWMTYTREQWSRAWKQQAPMMVTANLGEPTWCMMANLERTFVFENHKRPWNRRQIQAALDLLQTKEVTA
jgi:hypothetical protein